MHGKFHFWPLLITKLQVLQYRSIAQFIVFKGWHWASEDINQIQWHQKMKLKNVADAWHLIEKEGLRLAVKYGSDDRHCAAWYHPSHWWILQSENQFPWLDRVAPQSVHLRCTQQHIHHYNLKVWEQFFQRFFMI